MGLPSRRSALIKEEMRRRPNPHCFTGRIGRTARARWLLLVIWTVVAGLAHVRAADARPIVGPGASKDDVIDAYGWPTGQTQAGEKEILVYPQGRVVIAKGKVELVDFSLTMPWPAPRPRPGTAGSGESWYTSWQEALKEARRRQVRVLALFVGSDWSPPSKQFLAEVAESSEFLTAFLGSHVLLKLDYTTHTTQLKAVRAQNTELRQKFEVTTYPSLLLIESDGSLAARVDLNRARNGETYRAQVIAAVREARSGLNPTAGGKEGTAGATAAPAGVKPAPESPGAPAPEVGLETITTWTMGRALVYGLGGGSLLALLLVWSLRRMRVMAASGSSGPSTAAERVAEAASGLPSPLEMAEWPHERLRTLVQALVECDGYTVAPRAGGAEGDLSLMRGGDPQPCVIVTCFPATAGQVSAKRLRELYGTITVEGVKTGWVVAIAGFSSEAREYAQLHGLSLLSRDSLREQLRGLTEQNLSRVLGRAMRRRASDNNG